MDHWIRGLLIELADDIEKFDDEFDSCTIIIFSSHVGEEFNGCISVKRC